MSDYQLDADSLNIQYKYNTYNGVMALCEFHEDSNPSMLVNLHDENYYCFSCGSYGSIEKLIEQTSGTKKYIRKRNNIIKQGDKEWIKKMSYPLAYGDEYVRKRNITHEQITKFNIRSNDKEVILPMYDYQGFLCGIKVRIKYPNNGAKYFTFGKTPYYYGNCNPVSILENKVIVTEGIIGMLHFDRVGACVVSVISANRSTMIEKFIENSDNKFVIVFDDDYAGYLGALKLLHKTQVFKNVFVAPFCDVDGLSNDELLNLSKKNDNLIDNTKDLLYNIKSKLDEKMYIKLNKSYQKFLKYL